MGRSSRSAHANRLNTKLANSDDPGLAPVISRIGARIIDGVLVGTVFIAIFVSGFWVAAYFGLLEIVNTSRGPRIETSPVVVGAIFMFASIPGIVYEITMIATKGQTVGKMATRVQVVCANDRQQVPGWKKAVGRWAIPLAANLIIMPLWLFTPLNSVRFYPVYLLTLIYGWVIWSRDKQGLHDKTVGTVVVKQK